MTRQAVKWAFLFSLFASVCVFWEFKGDKRFLNRIERIRKCKVGEVLFRERSVFYKLFPNTFSPALIFSNFPFRRHLEPRQLGLTQT